MAAKPRKSKETFLGGPFDGYPVRKSDREYVLHTFDMQNERMAVYEKDANSRFVFICVKPNDGFGGANNE